ncbi:MAG TPA: DMT family transporter [Nocardioidaceae bacterium]|nr:DMT family transporter [Nocardioidaceae bacterium]
MLYIAVPAAIGAAAAFGSAGVLQHRATHETRPRKPLRPGLLVDLIRLAGFRSSVLLGIVGFALQVVALRFGPLIMVQPLLVTGVLFYLLLASALTRRVPDRGLMLGALTALTGLSAFLLIARPSGGGEQFSGDAALPLGVGLVIVVAACLAISTQIGSEIRSLPLAAATAVCYGVTAGLVRSLTTHGLDVNIFTEWELYAVAIVGPAGFLLNQNAYQSGMVGSLALAIITLGDPLVSIGIGVAWLGESIASDAWSVFGELLALAVLASGTVALAHRAQRVSERIQASGAFPEEYA